MGELPNRKIELMGLYLIYPFSYFSATVFVFGVDMRRWNDAVYYNYNALCTYCCSPSAISLIIHK